MITEQLNKVVGILRSIPRDPTAEVGRMRGAMEKVSERVAGDVKCEQVEAGGVPAEWIVPPNAANDRVVLYLHGGGYVMGSINTHRAMIARIARAANARGLALTYRLAPEHPFPGALDDSVAGYKWLLAQGYKPGKIVIAGDSAGGGLALAALLAIRDGGTPQPAAGILISPWNDLDGSGDSVKTRAERDPSVDQPGLSRMAKMYAGGADPKNPLLSPLHADFHGLPPLLMQVGDAEVLLDDSTRVAERAKAAGVKVDLEVWDDMVH
ncbi:MAG: alpha/beta hydrolase, partial [Candidatus Binataceae bacterium]